MLGIDAIVMLYHCAKVSVGDILEVGAYTGGATIAMAMGARNSDSEKRIVSIERGCRVDHPRIPTKDSFKDLQKNCLNTDRAAAALVKDLKRLGMLDETLVIWGGEFGRTPMVQGGADGRDHHPNAFTMWMAGGGIKGGVRIGETDELGFNVVKDKVHVHDLHATMLQLLGFDHTKLTYKFQGRNFRLTDVHGNVVPQLIA